MSWNPLLLFIPAKTYATINTDAYSNDIQTGLVAEKRPLANPVSGVSEKSWKLPEITSGTADDPG